MYRPTVHTYKIKQLTLNKSQNKIETIILQFVTRSSSYSKKKKEKRKEKVVLIP